MLDQKFILQVSRFAEKCAVPGQPIPTPVAGLIVVRQERPSKLNWAVYDPTVCLVLQGRKTAHVGDRKLVYGAGDALIVTHSVPTVSAVLEASRAKPYLALILRLDLNTLRELVFEFGDDLAAHANGHMIDVERADEHLVSCLVRLFRSSQDPLNAKAVAPLAVREAHFHLLRARHAGMLRQLMDNQSKASRVALATAEIQKSFRGRVVVADIAALTGMSISVFHKAFKEVTSMTPLQFQKNLRLIEARRLIGFSDKSVSQVAFEVGYESPSQFSREYSRKFGVSPSQDENQDQ
ncbi:MAG: AraC family transcriptional regulator [Pseudomonadota bacterium]